MTHGRHIEERGHFTATMEGEEFGRMMDLDHVASSGQVDRREIAN